MWNAKSFVRKGKRQRRYVKDTFRNMKKEEVTRRRSAKKRHITFNFLPSSTKKGCGLMWGLGRWSLQRTLFAFPECGRPGTRADSLCDDRNNSAQKRRERASGRMQPTGERTDKSEFHQLVTQSLFEILCEKG
jgi:hypothetical protein